MLEKNMISEFHNVVVTYELQWIYLVVFCFFLLSGVIGWFISTRKSRVEVKKLQSEIAKNKEELDKTKAESRVLSVEEVVKITSIRKSIFEKKSEYDQKIKEFGEKIPPLIRNLNFEKSEASKSDLSQYLYTEIILPFAEFYTLWRPLLSVNENDNNTFIKYYLLPFLKMFSALFEKVSQSGFSHEEFTVSKEYFSPIIKFGLENGTDDDIEILIEEAYKISNYFQCQFVFGNLKIDARNTA